MAKRQNFVVGSTNSITQTLTSSELNHAFDQYEILTAEELDGVFNAVSDYSNDSSNEIANAIQSITGSQPTGATQTELAGALTKMREDIETSSLTFKGYIATAAPSSSTYGLVEGNLWINSATLPTSFPVAATNIKKWNGTAWVTQSNTYTATDFDFWRNVNDNEGYYWFGGQWVVMSTDMSTTYFTLNQTSGKWEIKTNVNLPGKPTAATPASNAGNTQIANVKYVQDMVKALEPDLFDTKWRDATTTNPKWILSDNNWKTNTNGYNHLVEDVADKMPTRIWVDQNNQFYYTAGYTTSVGDNVYSDAQFTTSIGQVSTVGSGFIRANGVNYMSVSSSGGAAQTETIAGTTIAYYLADDGHKICDTDQETNAAAIYAATGVAWYYILDRNNQRFKLPRTKFGFVGLRDTVGKYVEAGLPNITGTLNWQGTQSPSTTGAFSHTTGAVAGVGSGYNQYFMYANFDASRSSSIYGNSTTVQPPATQMYLYFYVG